jgi:hypothetical protein
MANVQEVRGHELNYSSNRAADVRNLIVAHLLPAERTEKSGVRKEADLAYFIGALNITMVSGSVMQR